MHLLDQELNLMIRGRFDEAWKICQKLEKKDSSDLRHKFNRGWFLINQGKFQEGFQLLDAGRHIKVYGDTIINTTKPIWNNNDIKDKTVILNLEGGLGDQIIHVRFAKSLKNKGARCIVCCDPKIFDIIQTVEGVDEYIQRSQVPHTHHDYWIPSFSAGWLLGYDFQTLPNSPYLHANHNSVEVWKSLINSNKIKIGIRWSGNPKFEHQQFRIFPAEPLINLKKYKEIQLYSLQRDNDVRELPEEVIDLQYLLISWADTLAAIQNLDLVITSCTSIAHAASALGKPTWVIVPILPYHIWAFGDKHSPWYQETTRIFRQKKFGNWNQTFEEVEKELIEKYNLNYLK
jgi:hypothetical protein